MSPVLSTFSGMSARAFGLGYSFAASAFELIETQTVGAGGSASITFSSIPQTYKHLQIRGVMRTDFASFSNWGRMQFNSATTNYRWHGLNGDGASATSQSITDDNIYTITEPYAGNATGIFGAVIIDILDYASTSKNKTARILGGMDANGSGQVRLNSGLWMSTSAISSIKLYPSNNNYIQYTSFSLYGCK